MRALLLVLRSMEGMLSKEIMTMNATARARNLIGIFFATILVILVSLLGSLGTICVFASVVMMLWITASERHQRDVKKKALASTFLGCPLKESSTSEKISS